MADTPAPARSRSGFSLTNPGPKEYLIIGAIALVLGYWYFHKKAGAATTAAATTPAAGTTIPTTPTSPTIAFRSQLQDLASSPAVATGPGGASSVGAGTTGTAGTATAAPVTTTTGNTAPTGNTTTTTSVSNASSPPAAPCVVPRVVGLTGSQAIANLNAAGCSAQLESGATGKTIIRSQTPGPGANVARGSLVRISGV